MTIFDHGAALVPDIVTEAEEERILLRISQAPWLTDLSRRVQHYGFRYNYRGAANGRHDPAPPFPRWAEVVAGRLAPHFDGRLPEQCIVNEYRPGQGIGMHADHASFGPVVVSLSLGDAWTMNFRPRSARPYVREGWRPTRSRSCRAVPPSSCVAKRARRSCTASTAPPTRTGPRRASPRRSARSRPDLRRRFRPCRRQGPRRPGRRRGGRRRRGGEELWRSERDGDRERFPSRSSNHRHQPGTSGDEPWLSD